MYPTIENLDGILRGLEGAASLLGDEGLDLLEEYTQHHTAESMEANPESAINDFIDCLDALRELTHNTNWFTPEDKAHCLSLLDV